MTPLAQSAGSGSELATLCVIGFSPKPFKKGEKLLNNVTAAFSCCFQAQGLSGKSGYLPIISERNICFQSEMRRFSLIVRSDNPVNYRLLFIKKVMEMLFYLPTFMDQADNRSIGRGPLTSHS